MVFYPPEITGSMAEVPDSIPICDFMLNEEHGRRPISESWDPYVCGLTGATFSMQEQKDRVTYLARSLSKELGWKVNQGDEYSKVAGVFALVRVKIVQGRDSILNRCAEHR